MVRQFRGRLSVDAALRIASEAHLLPVVLDRRRVLGYGHSRRLASAGQTLALAARDRGCSFPGCDPPPGWCERHHVIPWQDGGPTDLNNLTLLCGYHHREHARRGWTCRIVDGQPHWTPPTSLDADQNP